MTSHTGRAVSLLFFFFVLLSTTTFALFDKPIYILPTANITCPSGYAIQNSSVAGGQCIPINGTSGGAATNPFNQFLNTTNNVTFDNVNATRRIFLGNGNTATACTPSLTFNNETDTGIRLGGSNVSPRIYFSINCIDIGHFNPTGYEIESTLSFTWNNRGGLAFPAISVPRLSGAGGANMVRTILGQNDGTGYSLEYVNNYTIFGNGVGTTTLRHIKAQNINATGNTTTPFLFTNQIDFWNTTNKTASIYPQGANLVIQTNFTSANGLAWFSSNVSATGYITRTEVWNEETLGKALDNLQDDSQLLQNNVINHSAFGKTAVSYPVWVLSGYKTVQHNGTDCRYVKINETHDNMLCDVPVSTYTQEPIYTKKIEQGNLLDLQVAKHEQALATYRNVSNVVNLNGTTNAFDTNTILAETIYTKSKVALANYSYIKKLVETNITKKGEHYAMVQMTLNGNTTQFLDMEARIAFLEGTNKQLVLLLCANNILKKADGCP